MSGDEAIDEDPRYQLSAKGAALFGVVYVVVGVITVTLGFTLGRPDGETTYIIGFPSWVFWTLIVWQVVVVGIIFALVRLSPYYRDIPLTESGEPDEPEDVAS